MEVYCGQTILMDLESVETFRLTLPSKGYFDYKNCDVTIRAPTDREMMMYFEVALKTFILVVFLTRRQTCQ